MYQGGALYFSAMALPHLGDFALTALLGSEVRVRVRVRVRVMVRVRFRVRVRVRVRP